MDLEKECGAHIHEAPRHRQAKRERVKMETYMRTGAMRMRMRKDDKKNTKNAGCTSPSQCKIFSCQSPQRSW